MMDPQETTTLPKELEWVLCSLQFNDTILIVAEGLNDLPSPLLPGNSHEADQ